MNALSRKPRSTTRPHKQLWIAIGFLKGALTFEEAQRLIKQEDKVRTHDPKAGIS